MSGAQLPLGLVFPRDQRLDGYRDPPPGLLASLAALAEGTRDGVVLTGGPGAGRSHLLLAACAHASERARSVAYLPLRAFAAGASAALAGQGGVHLVCVDDVQAIAGNREAEIALFDLHNRVRAGGGALLYAADAPPTQLPLTLPDLRSRLAQCAQFRLSVPDEAQRRRILGERARVRGLDLDAAVLDYLFRHTARDLASLTALLDRLDRASLAAQRRITVPFLKGVLEAR
ncbi:MAG: DnaA regulatory inactivator Hda [Proteobacteria bacterium]|nr:DnaA regulatory inactivator Hda [Pseudomonadota bacterium]